jgi:hypothetical protein
MSNDQRRDLQLMMAGVIFGVLAQSMYDLATTAVADVPYLSASWDKAIAAILVAAVLYYGGVRRIGRKPKRRETSPEFY